VLFSACILSDSNLYIQIYFKSKSSVLIFESNEGFGVSQMQNQACLFADMSLVRCLRFKIIPFTKVDQARSDRGTFCPHYSGYSRQGLPRQSFLGHFGHVARSL